MRLVSVEAESHSRTPTVNKNFSLGEEYVREAIWMDDETGVCVAVEVIAYVSAIRALRHLDGSVDLLGQLSRFDVLGKDNFRQPIERAVFIWRRGRFGLNGSWLTEESDMDYSNEIGLVYQPTLEAALANAKLWLDGLDFEAQFDPEAWGVSVSG